MRANNEASVIARWALLFSFAAFTFGNSASVHAHFVDAYCEENYYSECNAVDLPYSCKNVGGFVNVAGEHGNPLHGFYTGLHATVTFGEDSFGGDDVHYADWSSSDIVVFNGHSNCEEGVQCTADDNCIITCPTQLYPNQQIPVAAREVNLGTTVRLGEYAGWQLFGSNGNANYLILDSSCSMKKIDQSQGQNVYLNVMQGLRMALGYAGDINHDSYNCDHRLGDFADAAIDDGVPIGNAWAEEAIGYDKVQVGGQAAMFRMDGADTLDGAEANAHWWMYNDTFDLGTQTPDPPFGPYFGLEWHTMTYNGCEAYGGEWCH